MSIPFGKIGAVLLKIIGVIVPALQVTSQLAAQIPHLHGAAQEDAIVALVKTELLAAEGVTEKDLASDADVEAATRGVIQAVRALHAIVALRHATGV